MNEIIISVLLLGILMSAVKWAQSLKQERYETETTIEREGMIYMERLQEERERRNQPL